jgi:3-oxoacyl-[acyl-carrier protein] reductase
VYDLGGKVAIVTGASRGIGRAVAERLGREGASVAVNYVRNAEQARDVVAAIEAAGGRALAVQADASRVEDIRRLFASVVQDLGGLDIVVNCAGTSVFKPTAELSEDEFDRMFMLNARGTFFALQEAARRIRDGGRIVSISTGGTATSAPGGGAYTGSKAAVEQFTMALAQEVGRRGITVNAVLPGLTDTDGLILPKEMIEQMVQQTPLGRLGQPADLADAIVFLCSGQARWITGQSIRAAGG